MPDALRTALPNDHPTDTHVLQLTKRTEYGLIALIHMADRAGQVVSVREVGEHYPIPRRLLAEVVKDLARAGLVESQRGATGGYTLARDAEHITLGDVVVALEGAPLVASCDTHGEGGGSPCEVEPVCPIRSPLQRLREGIWRLMERTTLRSLSNAGPVVEIGVHAQRQPALSVYSTLAAQTALAGLDSPAGLNSPAGRNIPAGLNAHLGPDAAPTATILS